MPALSPQQPNEGAQSAPIDAPSVSGAHAASEADRTRPFDEELIWSILVQVCEGLHHMHSQRVLHRDIKAENVTVRPDRGLALVDLGATRSIDEQAARPVTRLVTESTAAPEQLADQELSLATDVYQLGGCSAR